MTAQKLELELTTSFQQHSGSFSMEIVDEIPKICYFYNTICYYGTDKDEKKETILWKELKLSKPVTSANPAKTVAAANARLPASPLAKPAAVLLTRNAKTPINNL